MEGLFVHVHKTGGSTIKAVLFHRLKVQNIRNLVVVGKGNTRWRSIRRDVIAADDFQSCFKFCFVRNPWDRVVSAYEFMLHSHRMRSRHFDLSFSEYVMDVLWNDDIDWTAYFALQQGERPGRIAAAQWMSKTHAMPYGHYNYCMDEMDFIGRFENFETEFRQVLSILGHEGRRIPHRNKSLPLSGRKPFQSYYTPELRDAVGRLYADDIAKFNYEFE